MIHPMAVVVAAVIVVGLTGAIMYWIATKSDKK